MHWTEAKPGKLVAVEGQDGVWEVVTRGGSTALLANVWSGERLRAPLTLLSRA